MKNIINSTQHDWPSIYEQWKQSGLNKSRFCKKLGIPSSSLFSALEKGRHLRKDSKTKISLVKEESPSESFVKVLVHEKAPPMIFSCVIEGHNGIKITVDQANVSLVQSLLLTT